MKRKKLLILTLCMTLASASVAFAAPVDTDNSPDVIEQTGEIGDELLYTLNTDTKKSEETPAQVTAKFLIPSGFHLNAYLDIVHDDGTVYRILTTDDNGYSDFAFVKTGHYTIMTSGIVNDNASNYTFTVDQSDFTVDADDQSVVTVTSTLDQYDEVAGIVAERTGGDVQELDKAHAGAIADAAETEEKRYPTALDGTYFGEDGQLYYETVSNSNTCTAKVYGNATGDYDLCFKVSKSGVIGEAELDVSLDGGKSFIGKVLSAEDYELSDYGVHLVLSTENDTDELAEGDTFRASVVENFAVNASGSDRLANVVITGHPTKKHQVLITLLSTGELGVAKYSLSYDNGVTTEYIDTLPENGVITYEDLTFYFANAEYTKNTTYTSEVESNSSERSYTPLYILTGVVVVLVIGFYIWLLSQKEKSSSYQIHAWEDRQDEQSYE